MTLFFVYWLKSAEGCNCIQSRQSLPMVLETNILSTTVLVDVVSNIIGVWPLVVTHLKDNGNKVIGDSLAVSHSLLF